MYIGSILPKECGTSLLILISLSVHRSVQFGCTIEMGLAQMKSLCLEDHRVYKSVQNHAFIYTSAQGTVV